MRSRSRKPSLDAVRQRWGPHNRCVIGSSEQRQRHNLIQGRKYMDRISVASCNRFCCNGACSLRLRIEANERVLTYALLVLPPSPLPERGPVALPESGNLCEEALGVAVVPRLRRLLHRHLPLHSLCLLRYLTAFIHQLRTSNHNTCPVPVSALSRVLARVMVAAGDDNGGRGDDDDDDDDDRRPRESQPRLASRLGEILILCYNDIFQNTDDDGDDLSDSVSSPSSVGECIGDGDEDDDDEGDTTTTDTDDFRSPPVSPQKTARPRGTATSVVRPPPLSLHQPPMSPR
ncbi:uncharacterized protein LOC134773908 [Penaeus indicus]|uniref:uncharacterized protein LOC134773908 n=1 Tax=Penaeus indicus TaxID=29960 RepID=UPI00300CC4F5